MTRDRRLWAANARVAHPCLAGQVERPLANPITRAVTRPVTDLCREPGGGRDKNLLYGQRFEVLEVSQGWAFGRHTRDGYVGYVEAAALGAMRPATHRVARQFAHIYTAADFKSPEAALLPYGAEVAVAQIDDRYARLESGWMIAAHLEPVTTRTHDPAAVAERFLGAPYLWGGNSAFGIDCSGLVQTALWAGGVACPRDSDMQEAAFEEVAEGELARGDLVFWAGHVGMMLDAQTLLHANAHHMCTAKEPLSDAVERIGQREFGAVTKFARPPPFCAS